MQTFSIELKKVSKAIGGVNRIDDFSMQLLYGKIYGIIGPNGAGKTTLLNIIMGLYKADSGTVSVGGYHPIRDYKKVRRLIGIVPQETALYPELSAKDNLLFHASLYLKNMKYAKERIVQILRLVDLTERADEPVKNYSGGMKRRLAIGRALLTDPDILLLDEPTLGVDVQGTHRIWEYIKALKAQNKTIIVTTNVMSEAEFLSDEIIILDHGRKLCQDTLDELKKACGRETMILKTKETVSKKVLENIFGTYQRGDHDEIILTDISITQNLFSVINSITKYSAIESLELRKPTLDDVFLSKTGKNLRT